MHPYQHVYVNSCHLWVDLVHKAIWAMKKLNLEWGATSNKRVNDFNNLDDFLLKSY